MAKEKRSDDPAITLDAVARFKFVKLWSSDRGVFLPGDTAELPQALAESLYLEAMGEIL